MDTSILNFLFLIAALWVGSIWLRRHLQNRLQAAMEELEQIREQAPVSLVVEEINGCLYSWNKDSQDFVCQGKSLEELRENFKLRYPGRNANIADGAESLLTRLRNELKHLKHNENINNQ